MNKAFIFDMDGVLVDTEHLWDAVRAELIGDWGGAFNGFLLCEKEGEKYESVPSRVEGKKEPKIYPFRTAEEPVPAGRGMPVDYVVDAPVWIAKQPKASSIR